MTESLRVAATKPQAIVPRDRVSATVAGQIVARERARVTRQRRRIAIRRAPRLLDADERRTSERVEIAVQVKFRHYRQAVPDAIGLITSLSTSGCMIETPRTLLPGMIFAGAISSPDERRDEIEFCAEVMRFRRGPGGGFGVRFITVEPSGLDRLKALVASAGETPPKPPAKIAALQTTSGEIVSP